MLRRGEHPNPPVRDRTIGSPLERTSRHSGAVLAHARLPKGMHFRALNCKPKKPPLLRQVAPRVPKGWHVHPEAKEGS